MSYFDKKMTLRLIEAMLFGLGTVSCLIMTALPIMIVTSGAKITFALFLPTFALFLFPVICLGLLLVLILNEKRILGG